MQETFDSLSCPTCGATVPDPDDVSWLPAVPHFVTHYRVTVTRKGQDPYSYVTSFLQAQCAPMGVEIRPEGIPTWAGLKLVQDWNNRGVFEDVTFHYEVLATPPETTHAQD